MLASRSGNGYCVPCAHPVDEVPLVPVSCPPEEFFQIRSAYARAVREYNEYMREWSSHVAPGSGPGSLRFVREKREDPTEVDHLLVPLPRSRTTKSRGTGRPPGRPQKLTTEDVKKLRRWAKTPGFTTKMLAERFKTHPRTIRHYLKRLGLKLKKQPARRARRS